MPIFLLESGVFSGCERLLAVESDVGGVDGIGNAEEVENDRRVVDSDFGVVEEVGDVEEAGEDERVVVVPFTRRTPSPLAQQSACPLPQQYVPSAQGVTSTSSVDLGLPSSSTRFHQQHGSLDQTGLLDCDTDHGDILTPSRHNLIQLGLLQLASVQLSRYVILLPLVFS